MQTQKLKKTLIKNLITLSIVGICMVSVTFAWFVLDNKGKTEQISVSTFGVDGMDISDSYDGEYSSEVSIESPHTLDFKAISGNGIDFYLPQLETYTGLPKTNDDGSWILEKAQGEVDYQVAANVDYAEYDLFFKGTSPKELFLHYDSVVSPLCTDIDAHPERKSYFGDFSKDYIAGATRVAFFDVQTDSNNNEIETLKYIWVPNSEFCLRNTGNGYKMITDKADSNWQKELAYEYYNGSSLKELSDFTNVKTVIENPFENDEAIPLLTLKKNHDIFEGHLRIKVWVEGTDREASSPLAGGGFSSNFKFTTLNS